MADHARTGQAEIASPEASQGLTEVLPQAPKQCKALKLTLPWPPSVNHYWESRVVVPKHGKPFVHTYISAKGKQFRSDVAKLCMDFKVKQWSRENAGRPLLMHLLCYPPDRRERDVSNCEKAVGDALQACGVIRSDFDVWDNRQTRACLSAPPGRLLVKISRFDLGGLAP